MDKPIVCRDDDWTLGHPNRDVAQFLFTDTRERAKRKAAEYANGMVGASGELYRQGFEAGFRVGYAAAETDQHEATSEPATRSGG